MRKPRDWCHYSRMCHIQFNMLYAFWPFCQTLLQTPWNVGNRTSERRARFTGEYLNEPNNNKNVNMIHGVACLFTLLLPNAAVFFGIFK